MVVLVSTKPRRLLIVAAGGIAITLLLAIAWMQLEGLPSLLAGMFAILAALLTISFFAAALVEGGIDRSRRKDMSNRINHPDVTTHTSDRCVHCHRPLVMAGGVSMCSHCDQ